MKAGKAYLTNNKCYMSQNASRGSTVKAYLYREKLEIDHYCGVQTLGTVTSTDYRYPTTFANGTFTADSKSSKYYLVITSQKDPIFVGNGNLCR